MKPYTIKSYNKDEAGEEVDVAYISIPAANPEGAIRIASKINNRQFHEVV